MADIPEHLLQRAKQARERLTGDGGGAAGDAGAAAGAAAAGATATEPELVGAAVGGGAAGGASAAAGSAGAPGSSGGAAGDKIPAHLLDRTIPAADRPQAEVAVPAAPAMAPAGPGGNTQRLLTVVKSGSIQDVKTLPSDKVHVWPHLLIVEFVAALAVTAFLLIFSIFVNAPLLELANFNETTNPSKAPWYFLGLQELLTMFHPMVAGVTIPGMGIFLLILAPYVDRNPHTAPEKRKFAIALMTIHLLFWATLVMIGSFFRGPGFNFVFPWEAGLFFDF